MDNIVKVRKELSKLTELICTDEFWEELVNAHILEDSELGKALEEIEHWDGLNAWIDKEDGLFCISADNGMRLFELNEVIKFLMS